MVSKGETMTKQNIVHGHPWEKVNNLQQKGFLTILISYIFCPRSDIG